MKGIQKYLFLMVSFLTLSVNGIINFRSKSSTIKLDDGVNLSLESQINECTGQIVKESGAVISGQDIVFNRGTFDDNNNRMKIKGRLKSDDTKQITLSGDELFRGKGASVIQSLVISGNNNRLEGDVLLADDIQLFDSNTGVTCALLRSLAKNIQLNGGKITLDEDLFFLNEKKLEGNGTVVCNNRSIVLGARESIWSGSVYFDNVNDLELRARLNLSQTWTFSGANCSIKGNGHVLNFYPHGRLVVDRGATLYLKDLVMHQLTSDDLICLDDTSKVVFENVSFIQEDTYTFSKGSFSVLGYLDLIGSSTFMISVNTTCTVEAESTIHVDSGMTLGYNSPVEVKNHLYFQGRNSTLSLKNATLYVTATGMQLQKGRLLVEGASSLMIDSKVSEDGLIADEEGLTVGNATTTDQDLFVQILPGSTLGLIAGNLIYKNMDTAAVQLNNVLSSLSIRQAGALTLYTPLNVTGGRLQLAKSATLLNFSGVPINGSVEIIPN